MFRWMVRLIIFLALFSETKAQGNDWPYYKPYVLSNISSNSSSSTGSIYQLTLLAPSSTGYVQKITPHNWGISIPTNDYSGSNAWAWLVANTNKIGSTNTVLKLTNFWGFVYSNGAFVMSVNTGFPAFVVDTNFFRNWNNITNTPTSLLGYGITNNLLYPISTQGLVNSSVTNGLASLLYVDGATNTLWSTVTNWILGKNYVTSAITNGLASLAYVDSSTNTLWSSVTNWVTLKNYVTAAITNGLASIGYVDSATNTLKGWTLTYFYPTNNPNSFTNQTVTNGLASVTYVDNATNGTVKDSGKLGGLAPSSYFTNNGGLYTMTIPDATISNQPVTLAQLRSVINANKTLYFTSNKTLSYTNDITPTNATYVISDGIPPVQAIRTNGAPIGGYFACSIWTNQLFTVYGGGSAKVNYYVCDNTGGNNTKYAKIEVYRYEPSTHLFIEWGDAAASNLVDKGAVPVISSWVIPLPNISTNVPWYFAVRSKLASSSGGGATTNIIVGVGTNYPSQMDITLSTADLGYLRVDGTLPMLSDLSLGGFSVTNVSSLIWSNGLTMSASTQALFASSINNISNWMVSVSGGVATALQPVSTNNIITNLVVSGGTSAFTRTNAVGYISIQVTTNGAWDINLTGGLEPVSVFQSDALWETNTTGGLQPL